jgi:hypothetical protein
MYNICAFYSLNAALFMIPLLSSELIDRALNFSLYQYWPITTII